jgi:decaprenylphospho-beta-D-erythro-pentofuranosid-2-ulose 2-reductase
VLTVNATASIQVALEVAKRMEGQRYGTIVLLSSVAGQRGRRDNYVYGASKAALDTFAEGLRQRLMGKGVRVFLVRPGFVVSRMTANLDPAPFAVSLEQSKNRILRGLDRGQDVVWIPSVLGLLFYVFRMLPARLWAFIVARSR